MPGAPLAGPGPYTPDTANPAILTFYRVDSKVFEEWKRNPLGRSLRELFLREGALEWWWFEVVAQHAGCVWDYWIEVNGGPIGMQDVQKATQVLATDASRSIAGKWFVDRFEGDILVRPNDYIQVYGESAANVATNCGNITVPPYEVWLLVAWKIKGGQEE